MEEAHESTPGRLRQTAVPDFSMPAMTRVRGHVSVVNFTYSSGLQTHLIGRRKSLESNRKTTAMCTCTVIDSRRNSKKYTYALRNTTASMYS